MAIHTIAYLALLGLAGQAFAQNPCARHPTKLGRLEACETASSFCSSYIAPNTVTYTFTTTTTTMIPRTKTTNVKKTTKTEFSYTSYTVSTSTLDGSTTTVASTTATPATKNCFSTSEPARKRSPSSKPLNKRAPDPEQSCGLGPNVATTGVSSACSCILAPTSTKTKTQFNTDTTTITIAKTTKTTTVKTVYTASTTVAGHTEYEVSTFAGFKIQATGSPDTSNLGKYAFSYPAQNSFAYFSANTNQDGLTFYLDDAGVLSFADPTGQAWLGNTNPNSVSSSVYFNTADYVGDFGFPPIICSIGDDYILDCKVKAYGLNNNQFYGNEWTLTSSEPSDPFSALAVCPDSSAA